MQYAVRKKLGLISSETSAKTQLINFCSSCIISYILFIHRIIIPTNTATD